MAAKPYLSFLQYQRKRGERMTLVRRGSCNRCGVCCEVSNCPKYTWATKSCSIHDTNWPPICREYPSHPCFMLTSKCGFKFYDKKTGREIDRTMMEASYYTSVERDDGVVIWFMEGVV